MRYLPAIRQMKALVEAGEIGEVLNFRGHMFHGSYLDPQRSMSWRLRAPSRAVASLQTLGPTWPISSSTSWGREDRARSGAHLHFRKCGKGDRPARNGGR